MEVPTRRIREGRREAEQKCRHGGAGTRGQERARGVSAEGRIGDWELLKQMEMEEREKDEAAAELAKAKAKRVTGTRISTGSTARASGIAQKARVCFT